MKKIIILLSVVLLSHISVAQYFGQNKVNYDQFEFKMYNTTHFNIYNYVENDTALFSIGQQAEKWNLRHFAIFHDTLKNNPIILYNNHPDFMQTTAISGAVGVGTGGVTESGRTRVVIPFMVSNKETDHVLGHEMVHVFQYNMVKKNDSLSLQNLMYVPLWMIEGLAEYLSIGPVDNQTAMWMRDAVIHNDIPTIEDMTKKAYKYFPYRYGHAFWSFVGGVWGDQVIYPLFENTLKFGPDKAIERTFKISADSLSTLWANSLKEHYEPYLKDTTGVIGEEMFGLDNGGTYNLSPVISPDGKYMTFISNRDVIGIDILMADLESKKIIKRLTKSVEQTHIDDFNFIEDVGSFSPDGTKYALTTFSKGSNNLLIVEVSKKRIKTIDDISIKGIDAFMYPKWSPDGNSILITGLVNGKSDLYLYDLETGRVNQLTNDYYSDIHPSWSGDGDHIIFISERGDDTNLEKQIYGSYKLCELNLNTKQVEVIDILPEADIYSPQYGPKDTSIFFLSNADGYKNLYRYDIHSNQIFKLSKFSTGVTGITDLAPAYSIAKTSGEIAYTMYKHGNYIIYKAKPEDFLQIPFTKDSVERSAEQLPPPPNNRIYNLVGNQMNTHPKQDTTEFKKKPYNPKFTLEYLGASGLSVGGSQWGTYGSGAIAALFTDMLKYNTIYTVLAVNGEVYDIGGQLAYISQKNRMNWGAGYSHIPYRYSSWYYKPVDTIQYNDEYTAIVSTLVDMRIRIFEDKVSFFNYYPLSSKLRFENGISAAKYSYRIDSINHYYNPLGQKVGETRDQVDGPDPFYVGSVNLAFVGDNSSFGFTSPLDGYRFRIEAEKMFLDYNSYRAIVDLRKYFYFKPLSFALRGMHMGTYGEDKDRLYPYYLGNHYFIRGYTYNSFQKGEVDGNKGLNINSLIGSKILVANAELRFPFSGYERLALIKSGLLYSDLVLFFDGGLAWNSESPFAKNSGIKMTWEPDYNYYVPVFSTGLSLRINLFGYAILEPYIAIPFQQQGVFSVFGLNITGGGW
ncbi:MAG: hypothetical protein R6V23_02670 [Bacteroidales bacterium]